MPKRKSIEYVREYMKDEGYTLISEKYVNCRSIIQVECPNGHIYNTKWNKFQQGRRCSLCAKTKRKTLEEVREYINSCGYRLLSNVYYNCNTELQIMCIRGHIYTSTWDKFRTGYRCSICGGKVPIKFSYIKNYIEEYGFIVILDEDDYVNTSTPIKIMCPKGHICNIRFNDFRHGIRCSECSNVRKKTIGFVREKMSEDGYVLLSNEYKNSESKLEVMCPLGHIFHPNWHNFKSGSRCPHCVRNISQSSQKWLDSLNIPLKCREIHIKTSDGHKYIDAYVEENNTVYEYFGRFWHGHPSYYNREDINPVNKISFGEPYDKTQEKINVLINNKYSLVYIWGE